MAPLGPAPYTGGRRTEGGRVGGAPGGGAGRAGGGGGGGRRGWFSHWLITGTNRL